MNTLFEDAFQAASIGMAFVGLDGKWLQINPSLCHMLGYKEHEMAAMTFQTIAMPSYANSNREDASRLFSGETDRYHGEQRFLRKDGSFLCVSLNACLVRNSEQHPACFFAEILESTGRREEARDGDAIFQLPTALHFVAGFDGYFKKLSNSWVEALGYPLEHLLSVPYLDLVHPDDRENTAREARLITESFNTFLFENRYRHVDGSYRSIVWTSISKPEEELVYGVALDYTARRKAEAEVEKTLREAMRTVADIRKAQKEISRLREGLLTVCAWTKRIRYEGQWMFVDEFLKDHLRLNLTHGISEEAMEAMLAGIKDRPLHRNTEH